MQRPTKTYELIETLARGGMGEVQVARERTGELFERLVVLKTVLPHFAEDEERVEGLMDEARVASQLQHPNVAQIYDIAFHDDNLCIVMEYLRGYNLGSILKELAKGRRGMEPEVAASILLGAAAGLGYAHRATDSRGQPLGVVHRDVSPQNIFLTRDGSVKVIDFGIALSSQRSTETQTGVLKGKLGYMAPEQLRGTPVDARTDIWALGVVAWELLTARRMYPRDQDPIGAVLSHRVVPPSQEGAATDPELDRIVLRMLERDLDRRYRSCEQIERALLRWGRDRKLPTSHQLAEWLAGIFAPEEDIEVDLEAEATATIQVVSAPEPDDTATVDAPAATREDAPSTKHDKPRSISDRPTSLHDRGSISASETTPALSPVPRSKPRRGPMLVVAAVSLLGLVAGVGLTAWWLAGPSGSSSQPVGIAAPSTPVAQLPTTPAPTDPATVTFEVEGIPRGASVWLDGDRVPHGVAEVPQGDATHHLEVRGADGHTLLARELRAERSVTIPLVALPSEPPPPDPTPAVDEERAPRSGRAGRGRNDRPRDRRPSARDRVPRRDQPPLVDGIVTDYP